MLVLTRKPNQSISIEIDGEVVAWVVVVGVERDRVKLGFNAPRRVKVLRSELYRPQIVMETKSG